MTKLRQTSNKLSGGIKPNATSIYRSELNNVLEKTSFNHLLYAVVMVLDEAISKGDCYILFGASRAQDAVTCTISIRGEKSTIYGNAGVAELNANLQGVLEP